MFYHADYYRIIVNEYDYECRAVHDYELIIICTYGESAWSLPRDTHTHKRTNEEDLWLTRLKTKSEVLVLHATEVQKTKNKPATTKSSPPPPLLGRGEDKVLLGWWETAKCWLFTSATLNLMKGGNSQVAKGAAKMEKMMGMRVEKRR